MTIEIEGKTVLVTGANRGIGKAITETMVREGASKVYAAVRNIDSAQPLVAEYGDRIVPIHLDLADGQSIDAAATAAQDVEIVVNNAGVLRTSTALDNDAVESLEFEMQVNVVGLLKMAQAFAPVLKVNGGGAFVQLNSVASMKCFPAFTTYCASKAAAYSVTQALRELLKEQGTAVVSVHPGPIATDMGDSAGFAEIAEPPSLVASAIVDALKAGEFHVFPDSMAKQVGLAYGAFAHKVVEAEMSEA